MAAPSQSQVLSLFRSLLRTVARFSDYNVRDYAWRRAADGFRANRELADPLSVAEAFAEGKSQLDVARRQAAVYSLYAPKAKSVMEIKSV